MARRESGLQVKPAQIFNTGEETVFRGTYGSRIQVDLLARERLLVRQINV